MICRWIRGAPLRKILAIGITPIWIMVVFWSLRYSQDIPVNAFHLLSNMCMVVYGGYFGSSAWETASTLKHGNREAPKPEETPIE